MSNETDWDYVERLISDLKSDGYQVDQFEPDTSFAAPKKQFWLVVSRTDERR